MTTERKTDRGPLAVLLAISLLLPIAGCGDSADVDEPVTGVGVSSGRCLLVAAAEFGAAGSLAVIDVDTGAVGTNVTTTFHDAGVRVIDGAPFVLNRLGRDNVTRLEPDGLGSRWQYPLGEGANPWDLVSPAPGVGLVSRYGAGDIAVVDLDAAAPDVFESGPAIDLSAYADADGNAEPGVMLVDDDTVWVLLQRLVDFRCDPDTPSLLLAIDTATLAPRPVFDDSPVLDLGACNARSMELGADGALWISAAGEFRNVAGADATDDGGLLRVEPLVGTVTRVLDEAALGGRDILDIVPRSAGGLWLTVSAADFAGAVMAFDGVRLGDEVWSGESLFDVREAWDSLWIADRTRGDAGVVRLPLPNLGGEAVRYPTGHPPVEVVPLAVAGDCVR